MTIRDLIQKWEEEIASFERAWMSSHKDLGEAEPFVNLYKHCLEELKEVEKQQGTKHWAKPYKAALDKC